MNANYAVWTQSSLVKVLKRAPVKQLDPVPISAAHNEHEAFQIVLRAGREPLEDVTVVVSDLVGGKSRIPASSISVYLPTYVYLPRLTDYYPDPLPPYSAPFDLQPGKTQPVWVDIYVPKDAHPGDYEGVITVMPANGKPREVRVSLHVYGFTLPDESKQVTAFGLLEQYIAEQHTAWRRALPSRSGCTRSTMSSCCSVEYRPTAFRLICFRMKGQNISRIPG